MNNELSVIESQGGIVSMAIDSLTTQVLQNADDGVELSVLDVELVESVIKASKSAQGFQRATLYWIRQKKGYLILGYESFEEFGLKEFELEKSTLHSMANAYHIQTVLKKSNALDSDKDIPIRSANQLNKLSDTEIPDAYQLANKKAQDDGKKLSTKHVEDAVKELQAKNQSLQNQLENYQTLYSESSRQRDQLRDNQAQIIEAKLGEERAKLILENQDAIAQAKREADNAKAEIERLKKDQAKAIKDGVFSEIQKRKTEIDQLEYRFESLQKQTDELKAVRNSLDAEVGALQIHQESIKNAKEYLTFLSGSFADAFDTATMPPETLNDWNAIKSALIKLTLELDGFVENNSAIDSAVVEVQS